MKRLLPILISAFVVVGAAAYEKLSPSTQAFLDHRKDVASGPMLAPAPDGEKIDAYIQLNGQNTARIEALGVEVNAVLDDVVTARIPVDKIEQVAALDEVKSVEIAERGEIDTDTTLMKTDTYMLHGGELYQLPEQYDGKGVVLGIIDSGIDFNHAAFQDSTGATRIKRVYMPGSEAGLKVAIDGKVLPGSEFDSTQVASLTTDYSGSAHGTHVMGIAAGTKIGLLSGMAPGADIVVCALGNNGGTDVNITNSLKYISQYAESVGKPAVVNISIGVPKGPRDGSSTLCKTYNTMGKNMVICQSVGNAAGNHRHISHTFTSNLANSEPVSAMIIGEPSQTFRCAVDAWSHSKNKMGVRFLLFDAETDTVFYQTDIISKYYYVYLGEGNENKSTYSAKLSQYFTGNIGFWVKWGNNGNYNMYNEVKLVPLNDSIPKFRLAIQYFAPDGALYISDKTSFDSWVQTQTLEYNECEPIGDYHFVVGNDSVCMNDNATASGVISVGNYIGRLTYNNMVGTVFHAPADHKEGKCYVTSSYGENYLGESFPFVSAPGYMVLSAYNSYNYLSVRSTNTNMEFDNPTTGRKNFWGSMSGTSMSTPTVAGIVACWLQRNPTLTVDSVKDIISKTAFRDEYVVNDSIRYGHGKINAMGIFPDYPHTLHEILTISKWGENRHYAITDSTLKVMHIAANGKTLYVKDSLNHWAAIELPVPLDSAQVEEFTGHYLKGVAGMLQQKSNTTILVDSVPALAEGATEVSLAALDLSEISQSQAMEVDTLRAVVWNAADKVLQMPVYPEEYGVTDTTCVVKPDFCRFEGDTISALHDKWVYDMLAVTTYDGDSVIMCPLTVLRAQQPAAFTLADVITKDRYPVGEHFEMVDSDMVVMHISPDATTLFAKDRGLLANPVEADSTQIDFIHQSGVMPDSVAYDQSNWVALHLPAPLDSAQKASYMGRTLYGVSGVLQSRLNPAIQLDSIPVAGAADSLQQMNAVLPANFVGSQRVDSLQYFFRRPVAMEIDTVSAAMWYAAESTFSLPIYEEEYSKLGLLSQFKPDFNLIETDSLQLTSFNIYQLLVLTTTDENGQLTVHPLQILKEEHVEELQGDVNKDGAVDVSDVSELVSLVLSDSQDALSLYFGDMNGDGVVDVSDVSLLVQKVLSY